MFVRVAGHHTARIRETFSSRTMETDTESIPIWIFRVCSKSWKFGQRPTCRLLTCLLVFWSLLPAHAVAPRLTNILPPGAQRGTEVDVRFTGQRLDDTKEIVFYTPGISVVSMDASTNRIKATLKIAGDCRLGEHQMRLRTATGISELRTFWVDALTNLAEVEPNSDIARAQKVPLNVTINGSIPSEDIDYFLVAAEKGQSLTAEIEGMRLGRGVFDPYIAIQDKSGKVLGASEDSALGFQDGIVSIIAPESGDYIVQVRETSFGGRDDYHYRLHVGTFPRPTGVSPVAGRAGERLKVKFLGDVKGEFEQEIRLPETPQEKFGVFAEGRGGHRESGTPVSNSPLTPALPPLRGEGVATDARRDLVASDRVPTPSSHPNAPGAAKGAVTPDNDLRAPSPLNGERAGVRGESFLERPTSPSPNWMHVTSFPTTMETEPNDSREQAGEAREVPIVFNGIISKPGDHDWFRFRAKKGQNLQVTVFARRLRSPLDSAIQIANAKGSPVADNDDAAGPDSSVNFKPDEDGEYAVLVRDHLKRGGPDFVYCVEVAPVEPSLTVKIPEVARNDTQSRQYIAVPRGNRFATLVSVKRTGLSGDLSFRVDSPFGVPASAGSASANPNAPDFSNVPPAKAGTPNGLPAGVKLVAETLPAKIDQFPLVFEAAPDAPIDGKLIELVAVATNGVTGHYRNDISLVEGPNNTSYYGTRLDKLLVTVTEAAPFRIRIAKPKVPLVQGGTMDLKIVAERNAGFDEPINLKMVWNPPGVTSQPDITIPKGATSVSFPLSAKSDAELREWKVAVLASAKVKEGDLFISTQLAPLTVGEPFLTATIEKTACEAGRSTNIIVKLEQKIPFEGQATIKLVGLSDKVSTSEKQITKDDKEVIFPVKVDASCSPGSQRNLFCAVSVKKDGEVIPHSVGQGGSFRVVPPKKPAQDQKKIAKNEK